MSKLKPYPEYKDSGIEWIGEIPKDWLIIKLRYITDELTDYTANGSFKGLAENVQYRYSPNYARLVRLTDLRDSMRNPSGIYVDKKSYDYLSKSSLYGGEFLIANVGAYAGHIEQMPFINMPATLGPNMMMAEFNNKKADNKFMIYAGKSSYIQTQLESKANSSSAQPKLNKEDFRSVIFVMPTLKEQRLIVNYLDQRTSQIDSLIADKKRLIELLEEKRQAVITETVTKGLDPNVKMKDSGVEWIGEIPEHWEVTRLKHLGEIIMGQSPEAKSVNDKQIGYPFLQGNAEFKDLYPEAKHHCDKPTKLSKQGDILLSVRAPVGAMNWSDKKYVIGRGLCSIRVKDNTEPNFLWYALSYLRIELYSKMAGSTFEAVTLKDVRELHVMQPSFKEQQEISIYLSTLDKRINDLKQAITEQIIKLKQYRESLIYEAVTGKIDLRDYEVEHL